MEELVGMLVEAIGEWLQTVGAWAGVKSPTNRQGEPKRPRRRVVRRALEKLMPPRG